MTNHLLLVVIFVMSLKTVCPVAVFVTHNNTLLDILVSSKGLNKYNFSES